MLLPNCTKAVFEYIEETAFVHVPCLKKLDLSRNPKLSGTTGRTFLGLYNLEELNLAFSSNIANPDEKDFQAKFLTLDKLRVLNISCALNSFCDTDDEYEETYF